MISRSESNKKRGIRRCFLPWTRQVFSYTLLSPHYFDLDVCLIHTLFFEVNFQVLRYFEGRCWLYPLLLEVLETEWVCFIPKGHRMQRASLRCLLIYPWDVDWIFSLCGGILTEMFISRTATGAHRTFTGLNSSFLTASLNSNFKTPQFMRADWVFIALTAELMCFRRMSVLEKKKRTLKTLKWHLTFKTDGILHTHKNRWLKL